MIAVRQDSQSRSVSADQLFDHDWLDRNARRGVASCRSRSASGIPVSELDPIRCFRSDTWYVGRARIVSALVGSEAWYQ